MAASLRVRFRAHAITTGDAAVVWSESRPGWVAALWACLLDGVVVVPVDPKSSQALFERIANSSRAKIVLTGEKVSPIHGAWSLAEIEQSDDAPSIARLSNSNRTPSPKLFSRPEQPRNPRASSSRIATCSPIWSPWRARWPSTANTPSRFCRFAF